MKLGRLLVCAFMVVLCVAAIKANMTVHHINVEQGEATLLEFDTAAVLVDADGFNGTSARTHLFDYLDRFFAQRTDLRRTFYSAIVTHPTLTYLAKTMQIEFFVMIPATLQHTCSVFDEDARLDDWKKKLALHNLEKERLAALKKLKQLYAEVGFKSVKGTNLMVCDAVEFL